MKNASSLEPLEARIAPAAVLTYTDVDGDLVTVTFSKGTAATNFLLDKTPVSGSFGEQLRSIVILGAGNDAIKGLNITLVATPQKLGGVFRGDGLANVGSLIASDGGGTPLGNVTIDGDLGVIDAGNTALNAFALQTLTVQSLGLLGTTTGAPADLQSDLAGSVKSITVKSDVRDVYVNITGSTGPAMNPLRSSLGALTIGGSILASNPGFLGSFNVAGDIGPVKVGGSVTAGPNQGSAQIGSLLGSMGAVTLGGDLVGGPSGFSGYIFASQNMGAVTIGGDIRGGGTTGGSGNSGFVSAGSGSMGAVKIGGSIIGGASIYCGSITADTAGGSHSMGTVTVGGSVLGGGGANSGQIFASGSVGAVKIGGSLTGAAGTNSGFVYANNGNIASVTIGGDVRGGGGISSGALYARGNLGPVKITGNLEGGAGDSSGRIYTNGTAFTPSGNIASVSIGGDLIGGSFNFAGSITASVSPQTLGKLGAVTILGDMLGGTATNTARISAAREIASVTIGGSLVGGTAADSGLLVSGANLGAVKIGGDLEGGAQARSGAIISPKDIKSLTIAGSMLGGGSDDAGSVSAGNFLPGSFPSPGSLGPVKIGGDLEGGAGLRSGRLFAVQNIGAITITGSVLGGGGSESGTIKLGRPVDLNLVPLAVKQTIASITVGGDWTGGSGAFSGTLTAEILTDELDLVGPVKVAGDWKGGSGPSSGAIRIGSVASIAVGGSLVGGSNSISGFWRLAKLGSANIGRDMIGGSVDSSGCIAVDSMNSLKIGGSLIGGSGSSTGLIEGRVSVITIGQDLRGGDAIGVSLNDSGSIRCSFTSLTIGGSILAGRESGGGEIGGGGAIYNTFALGAITVKGSLVGHATEDVVIGAGGSIDMTPGLPPFVAIKSLTVGGRVDHALIITGRDASGNYIDPDGQIGPVKVGGDWIASSLVAGVNPVDGRFGDGNDIKADQGMRDHPELFSKIASITIGGHVLGAVGDPAQTFAFAAEEIGSFKVNGVALKLNPGRSNDKFASPAVAGSAVPIGPSRGTVVSDGFAVHVFEL